MDSQPPRLDMPPPPTEANLIDLSTPTPGSTSSQDADFGAFISSPDPPLAIPAAQSSTAAAAAFDPLAALEPESTSPASPETARNQRPASMDFFSGATQRTLQKRADVLGELLAHEDDPLYWVERHQPDPTTDALTEGLHTPMFEQPPRPVSPPVLPRVPSATTLPPPPKADALVEVQAPKPRPAALKHAKRRDSDLLDFDDDVKLPEEGPPSPPPTPLNGHPVPLSPPPQPQRPVASPLQSSSRSPSRSRSHSTTPTPGTVLSRTGTLGRKWMSSLLSSASSSTASSSLPETDEVTPQFSPRRTDSLALLSSTVKHPPGPVASTSLASSSVSHGTPFARGAYVPPSGAPAFRGDREWDRGFEFSAAEQAGAPVTLAGRSAATAPVLSASAAARIRPYLPPLARLEPTWTLLYSLDQHGISLSTLYKRCANPSDEETPRQTLVVVRDADDGVFGAFVPEGVGMHRGYYGSGESFLWRSTRSRGEEDGVQVYRWTGRNTYVALCEPAYVSFGGGDGHYGLWLDATLFDGSSARCPTFDNDVLSGPPRPYEPHETPIHREPGEKKEEQTVTDKFECVGLEVWWIGSA